MVTKAEQVEVLFGKLDTQLRNRQIKRALKTADEGARRRPAACPARTRLGMLQDHPCALPSFPLAPTLQS